MTVEVKGGDDHAGRLENEIESSGLSRSERPCFQRQRGGGLRVTALYLQGDVPKSKPLRVCSPAGRYREGRPGGRSGSQCARFPRGTLCGAAFRSDTGADQHPPVTKGGRFHPGPFRTENLVCGQSIHRSCGSVPGPIELPKNRKYYRRSRGRGT